MSTHQPPASIQWIGDARTGFLRLLDQTQLPHTIAHLDCRDIDTLWSAIRRLVVRGAPAIGVAAAYGCVIGAQTGQLAHAIDHLATSRPTAVNLFWALDRVKALNSSDPDLLLTHARDIHAQDAAMCLAIGRHAQHLIAPGSGILTHCNAGALATAGIGTATAPLYLAHAAGRRFKVFSDETRPLLQGGRLTAWELGQAGIDVTVICDSMASQVMREGRVNLVIVGADRIAANGDTANKIGTYQLAIAARHHRVPFYVAAPSSTFDLACPAGSDIPIEQRSADEIAHPPGSSVYNPAFDVTPADLITAIITERGIIQPVTPANIRSLLWA
jgi:methylthioribose-1-phosphate isomerase